MGQDRHSTGTVDLVDGLGYGQVVFRDVAGDQVLFEGVLHGAGVAMGHEDPGHVGPPHGTCGQCLDLSQIDGEFPPEGKAFVNPLYHPLTSLCPLAAVIVQRGAETTVPVVDVETEEVDVLVATVGNRQFHGRYDHDADALPFLKGLINAIKGVVVSQGDGGQPGLGGKSDNFPG